ncbi:glycosyltransferase [Pseudomonas sp. 1928-m]|uniref:glycosyltransferase n=1 Tax=Pseudomonas sp. 1928-m TaxID=3033804 RepID=UPI0023DED808|nr:glycosyltransferase [Pseudomonas sp. 1928-m]MDF3194671.1 glycosyltransferase [Pseudomonas sp. 1928-m]
MKLLYLAQSDIPSQAANSIHVMKMCDAFSAQGCEVSLWLPARKAPANAVDVCHYYGVSPSFEICWLSRIAWLKPSYAYAWQIWARLLKARQLPDLVFSRSLLGAVSALLAGANVVLEVHQSMRDSGFLQGLIFKWIVRHKRFQRLVVITKALKDWHVQQGLLAADLIHVAPDGAELPVSGTTGAVYGFAKTARFNVGYVGSLHQGKGMEIVLPLARLLADVDFHVVGGSDAQLRDWRGKAAGLENLRFHGFMPPADVHRFMLDMDVLLAPNQRVVKGVGGSDIGRWTSPLKIFEYMAARKPILASDLPVLREVLLHEVNCLLCTADSPEYWAQAVRRLRDDHALAQRLAERAHADLLEMYSWSCRASILLATLAGDEG